MSKLNMRTRNIPVQHAEGYLLHTRKLAIVISESCDVPREFHDLHSFCTVVGPAAFWIIQMLSVPTISGFIRVYSVVFFLPFLFAFQVLWFRLVQSMQSDKSVNSITYQNPNVPKVCGNKLSIKIGAEPLISSCSCLLVLGHSVDCRENTY